MRATDHLRLIRTVVDRVHSENNISIDATLVVDDTFRRIYNREAEETLTYSLPDFSTNCLHNTALGKSYLSSLPEEQLSEKIEAMSLSAKTDKTITDKQTLLLELKKAKARRYAMSEEEYLPGLIAIGAPLCDPISGKGVGAVSFDFSVLQHGADDIRKKYANLIKTTATTLSELLPPDLHHRSVKK
jgi:DNA-binding IclR family transcriptional regulator